jgi:hypothetical protein
MSEVDKDALKSQIDTFKKLQKNGYLESAGKELDSIAKKLEKIKSSHTSEYDEVLAYLDL